MGAIPIGLGTTTGGVHNNVMLSNNPGMPVLGNNTGAFNSATGGIPGGNNGGGNTVQMPGSNMTGMVPPAGASTNIDSGTGWNGTSQSFDSQKQLTDIYGKGIGGMINNQINNQSNTAAATSSSLLASLPNTLTSTDALLQNDLSGQGANMGIMQNYDAALAPTLASNQATLNAQLGSQGIGANSSTSALANSNLVAQTQAQESNEAASLVSQQEGIAAGLNTNASSDLLNMNLQANNSVQGLLQGTQSDAAQETASSGWQVFGNVLDKVGGMAASVLGGSGIASSIMGGLGSAFGAASNLGNAVGAGNLQIQGLSTDTSDQSSLGGIGV